MFTTDCHNRSFTISRTLENSMTPSIALSSCPLPFPRMQPGSLLLALACLLTPIVARAQVSFSGKQPSVNIGSQPVGSASATVSLPFTIGAATKVGSIAVLTTGIVDEDFASAKKSTCTATTYATATNCVVNVSFTPLAAGLRRGAVVFYSRGKNAGTVLATVPVFGVGTAPQVVFGPGGTQTSVGSKLISPLGVTVDAAGNVYVSDIGLQEVFKVTPDGTETTVGSGLDVPQSVAVDGAGNVYIADSQYPAVFKVTPDGVQTMIGSGFDWPSGVAVDGAGNVYVSDPFADAVFKITPGGKQTTVGGGYNTPAGVAVDASGNLYVADTYNAAVYKITSGGKQTTIGAKLTSPAAVAVDAGGNLYITDSGTDSVYEVTPGGVQTTLTSGLNVPDGVAVDGFGNLYLANTYNKQVVKIDRADVPTLKFDSTQVGSTSADSPKAVQVENIGNATLQFSALTYPADFPKGASGKVTECTASVSLASASTCVLTIDFSPVKTLGSKISALLREDVNLVTNNLNVAGALQQAAVTGTETRP
jgi:sugar lactone lactonase YvrE